MKKGFYTALGTSLNEDFTFCAEGMITQIEQQIEAGASGLLVMGSMGNMSYVKNSEYVKVAKCCAEAVKGRIPVLVGVTDVSINRVMDRVEALEGIRGIDGIVSTVPYYAPVNQTHIFKFYNEIANRSGRHTYLYDLPGVTKVATDPDTVKKLWANPNIKGIKSGNMVTHRVLMRAENRPDDFTLMYSNIDTFDIAYKYGINYNLDGMFSCTPKTAKKMYQALEVGDMATAGDALDGILALRDLFLSTGCLMSAFTHSMNLLGCKGFFGRDYEFEISGEKKALVTEALKKLGEI